jgi:hypothetical protein
MIAADEPSGYGSPEVSAESEDRMRQSGLSAEDTIALQRLCVRYGWLVDERRWDELDQVFTADVAIDVSAFRQPTMVGIDAVRAQYRDAAHPVAHHVTDILAWQDGETTRIRSKVISLLAGGLCGSGTYDDVAVSVDGEWRIARRVIGLRRERDLPQRPPRHEAATRPD